MIPAGLRPGAEAERDRAREAARALETMVLKQIVAASGAFKGGASAGAGIREDLFANALADALVRAGGIGLADQVERSVLGNGTSASPGGAAGVLHPGAPIPGAGPQPTRRPAAGPAAEPVPGAAISSAYGARTDPLTGQAAEHHGVDLAAPEGTEIRASLDGVVRAAGPRGGYGLAVEVEHAGGVTTLYGHASELLVQDGDRVARGQPIARVGQTGRSTGPHLHLEVRKGGQPVEPLRALKIYNARAEAQAGSGS